MVAQTRSRPRLARILEGWEARAPSICMPSALITPVKCLSLAAPADCPPGTRRPCLPIPSLRLRILHFSASRHGSLDVSILHLIL